MSEWRVAFAGEAPEHPLEWRVVSDNGDIKDRGAGSLDAFARTRGDKTALVLPGMQVNCLNVALAARNERQARAAAPFAIEDDVAGDLENIHVALLAPSAEPQPGMRTRFATDTDIVAGWTGAFEALGGKLTRRLPDYMCLPSGDGDVSVALAPGRAIMRAGHWGAAVDEALGQTVLDAILDQCHAAKRHALAINPSVSAVIPRKPRDKQSPNPICC